MGIAQRTICAKFEQKKSPFSPHNQLPQSEQTLGDWIKARRIGKKLTPGHLAAKIGITSGLVCAWEAGEVTPSGQQVEALSKVIGEAPPLRDC